MAIKQGTPVILVQGNSQAIGGEHGTAEIFSFQGRDAHFIEVISEDGVLTEYAIGFIAVIQEVTDDLRKQIMDLREQRKREETRKKTGLVTAAMKPPKDFRH